MLMIRYLMLSLILLFTAKSLAADDSMKITQDGVGEVLIFPFFTTQNGWDTYINVFRHSGRYPISSASPLLHLKFRSAETGDVVKSLNAYVGSGNNFRFSLSKDEAGKVTLRVAEGLCVLDGIGYGFGSGAQFDIPINTGSLEVYHLGGNDLALLPQPEESHCAEQADYLAGIEPDAEPVGQYDIRDDLIYGTANLMNVQQGLSAAYEATAITNTRMHALLGSRDARSIHPLNTYINLSRVQGGIDALAKLMMAMHISNEVVVLDELNAQTDWVISYPLAGYKNHKPFSVLMDGRTKYCGTLGLPVEEGKVAVQQYLWIGDNSFIGSVGGGEVYDAYKNYYDIGLLPDHPKVAADLCHAVNVVSFDRPSILQESGSILATRVDNVLPGPVTRSTLYHTGSYDQAPVLGFRLTSFKNGTLDNGNTLANYALLTPHRYFNRE